MVGAAAFLKCLVSAILCIAALTASANAGAVAPLSIAVWKKRVPDAWAIQGGWYRRRVSANLVAGGPWTEEGGITNPTMSVYLPAHNPNRVMLVVFPGGGYRVLAVDLEGSEICEWFVRRNIACAVLYYRVPGEGGYPAAAPYPGSGPYPESPLALDDAQRALRLVRYHADAWHIDPHRVGAIGFSAGADLVAVLSTQFNTVVYRPMDDVDRLSSRPDFGAVIYPGHIAAGNVRYDESLLRQPGHVSSGIHVTKGTPPQFIVQAEDDAVDGVQNALAYYAELSKAGIPAEMHLYARGGHAFGLRNTHLPISAWPTLMYEWLERVGDMK